MRHWVNHLLAGLLLIAMIGPEGRAHDEPPKTIREKNDQQKSRDRIKAAAIELQQVWLVKPGIAPDSSLWLSNRFDHMGNLVEQIVYDTSGNFRSICLYDDRNLLLEELSYGGDSFEDRTIFVYDGAGLVRQIASFNNSGELTDRLNYHYNEPDQSILLEKWGPQDSLQYSILYKYKPGSDFGSMTEAIQNNADGSLKMRVHNRYMNGQRSEKLIYGPDDNLLYSFAYTYTPSGEFNTVVKIMTNDSMAVRQQYIYTREGLLEGVVETDVSGSNTRTIHYHYIRRESGK